MVYSNAFTDALELARLGAVPYASAAGDFAVVNGTIMFSEYLEEHNITVPGPPPAPDYYSIRAEDSVCFVDPMVTSQGAEAVMFIFIAGVILGAVPQYLKLILLADAEGISMSSLALMNVSNLTATLNIFILHFEQIKQCVRGAAGFTADNCKASLLTFYYTLVYTLLWFPLYPLAAHFCGDRKTEVCGHVASGRRHAWNGFFAHLLPCFILAAPVLRMVFGGTCFGLESYAMLLGVMNAVLEATRYLPQVYASFYGEGSGALSYLRLMLSVGGGVGATVQKAIMHEDISTWFPPLVGHGLEIIIIVINLYHDLSGTRGEEGEGGDAEGDRSDVEEGAPLLGGRAEKGEARGRAGGGGGGSDSEASDWLDEMPRDAGFVEQSEYVCDQMCTNPKFLNALLKYM